MDTEIRGNRAPTLSVIVLTYNSERTIAACLDSLVNQTSNDFEVIIVDDASTDRTLQIVESYRPKLHISILQNGSNRIARGRNIGFKAAESDLIAYLDSDDCADIRWVETTFQTYEANPDAGVLSGSLVFSGESYTAKAIAAIDTSIRQLLGKDSNSFSTANSVFNKKLLGDDYLFNENFKYSEDRELANRIQKKFRIAYQPDMKVYQSSRESFGAYARQMYVYGVWSAYYDFAAKSYALAEFIPLVLILASILGAMLLHTWALLVVPFLFSLCESLYVSFKMQCAPMIAIMTFPAWIIKNFMWSFGAALGLASVLASGKVRARLVVS